MVNEHAQMQILRVNLMATPKKRKKNNIKNNIKSDIKVRIRNIPPIVLKINASSIY